MEIKKKTFSLNKYCPIAAQILIAAAALSGIIHFVSFQSSAFSDFINVTLGRAVRTVLAYLTGWIPFSLAETIVILLPLFFVAMIILSVRLSGKSTNLPIIRFFCSLLAVLAFIYSVFACGFAPAYQGSALSDKLGLERKNVSAQELYLASEKVLNELNELVSDIDYKYGSFSVMPYTLDEMNDRLNDAYSNFCGKYSFVSKLHSNVKYIMLSEPMTYTHIAGVYSFFTGEANINVNFPDYTLPFTAAHEMAHQRGIAREDEANFIAFLVCLESDDSYIRYSGYMSIYEYLISALYSADKNLYSDIVSGSNMKIRYEQSAYSAFFDKYRDSVASDVSSAVNDTYLKSQGQTEGSKSYGMVVDLAVAYYNAASLETGE